MEHILQFAIGIDDNAIAERVVDAATKELVKDVKKDIYDSDRYYGGEFSSLSRKVITEAIEGYKDEIISKAAAMLCDSIKRSKRFKEVTADILSEES